MILFYHFIVFLETGYLFVCKSILFHISFLCFSNLYFNHRIYVSWFLMFAIYFRYVMYICIHMCQKCIIGVFVLYVSIYGSDEYITYAILCLYSPPVILSSEYYDE